MRILDNVGPKFHILFSGVKNRGFYGDILFEWPLKLDDYGLHGTSNSQFKSYLDNDREQLVPLNGENLETKIMKHGVPQGSVLGPLLFLIYINDLHIAILHSHSYQFADNAHHLTISNAPKKVQKQFNIDLKCS